VTHSIGTRWIRDKVPGSVISILTTWVWNGGPFTVPSAMSKAGVNIMTKSLAAEWGPYGIRLNAIAPGPFPTEGAWARLSPGQSTDSDTSREGIPMGRVGQMGELKNLATFLMADGCEYLTGQCIAIDGAGFSSGAGNFAHLSKLSDDQWAQMREMIRSANDKDKAQRSV
jgi:NAD(P)-dependent dehydrogenase (short-subunit alcohol dehydrogenase family)